MREIVDDEDSADFAGVLHRTLAGSNVPVIVESDNERVLACTEGAAHLCGWQVDDLLGQLSPLPRSSSSDRIAAVRESARSGRVHALTKVPVMSRRGQSLACDLVASPLPIASGVNGILFTLQPVISASEGRPPDRVQGEDLLEAIPIPMFLKDSNGRYTGFNVAWERFFGRRRDEWLGRTVADMFPADEARTYRVQDDELLRQGGMLEWEGRLRNQRGESAPVVYRKTALRDSDGHVMGIAGAIVDITALRLAESRFREVVELAPGALIVCDADDRIVLVNAHAERLFGYERQELVGQPIDSLLPERFRASHAGYRQAFFQNPSSRPMGRGRDLFALRRDGVEVPVEVALGQLPSDGGPMVIAVVADITARKKAQMALESSLREKTILLDEVHHRVKNNLQVISSLLSLQSSSSDDPGDRQVLSVAVARVRAIGLTYELLYERGDFTALDLAVYLDRLIRLIRSAAGPDAGRIRLNSDLGSVLVDMGQAMHCGLILNEIIANAFKHAFPGERAGSVDIFLRPEAGGMVTLKVSDDGQGFDPDTPETRSGALGLRLVKMLTEQLGGTLQVTRPGTVRESVRFELRFPSRLRSSADG